MNVYTGRGMLKYRENVPKQKKIPSNVILLDYTNQSNIMHAHIRNTVVGAHKGNATTRCIEDKHGNIIIDQDMIRTRWFECICEFYKNDNNKNNYHTLILIQQAFLLRRMKFSMHCKGCP